MKKIVLYTLLTFAFTFCKKTFDNPPYKPANDGAKLSIRQLKQKVTTALSSYKFISGDTNLYCVVTADETSGNLYKQIYVKDDENNAIQLNLINSGGLYIGDKIRINLNTIYLISANNMIYLDSVDVEKSVVKLSSGNAVTPKVATISDILKFSADPTNATSFQSQLVEINGVEFDTASRGKTFADAIGKNALNRTITTCSNQKLIVRSSGRSNFAAKLTPNGNGKIVGVISQYQNDMQLTIRNYNELQMNNTLCTGTPTTASTNTFILATPVYSISESFNAISSNTDFTQSGWINYNESGSVKWKGHSISTYKALKASAYNSGNTLNSIWLITPPIIYKNTMTLNFKSGFMYWDAGHQNALTAYVSTNFNGTNFETANWTAITAASYVDGTGAQYSGAAGMKPSGSINLNSIGILNGYSGNFFVAFKHVGTPAYNSDIFLDDVVIQ